MYVCFFIEICSTTSLSGKWVVGGRKRVRSGKKSDMVGVFGANKIIGSSGINPFTARSFYQSTMSPQRSSYGAYNLGST